MTTDRHDPETTSGLSDEFWGEQTEWVPREPSPERSGPQVTIRRWWDALLGGGAVAARSHGRAGVSVPDGDEPVPHIERPHAADRAPHEPVHHIDRSTDDDAAATEREDTWTHDEAWTVEPESPRGRHPGVDPLLARLGGLAVIVTLAAPLVVGFTGSGTDAGSADALRTPDTGAPPAQVADPATTVGTEDPTAATAVQSDQSTGSTSATAPAGSLPTPPVDDGGAEPKTTAPCGAEYELAAGDYWIRIADAAGVSLAELLDVNDSSVDTVLVPGRSICLPLGAATPAPPTTVAPASAPRAPTAPSAPSPTSAPSRPTTAVAPAPATNAVARPAAVPPSQAVAVIRDVWPDDLEDRAIDIAWRESNHRSNVNNYCCYGLFQIHWEAHRSWLSTLGVTSASQLYDPVINATAAYTLYQRSGGFGPWGG